MPGPCNLELLLWNIDAEEIGYRFKDPCTVSESLAEG